jgi:hypothetical protein
MLIEPAVLECVVGATQSPRHHMIDRQRSAALGLSQTAVFAARNAVVFLQEFLPLRRQHPVWLIYHLFVPPIPHAPQAGMSPRIPAGQAQNAKTGVITFNGATPGCEKSGATPDRGLTTA